MNPVNYILDFFGNMSKPLLLLLCVSLVVVIGLFDYIAKDFSLLVLNLLPIFLAAWFTGVWFATAISALATLSWLITDIIETPAHSHCTVHCWNAIAQFLFLFAVSYFLVALKNSLMREKELARRDPLTGAFNGRAFVEIARNEINRSRRYRHPFTFAYMDIDGFKAINDNFGHSAGDELLKVMTGVIKSNLRNIDTVSRLGGDEFAIILPETPHGGAVVVMNRLRNLLIAAMKKNGWPTTFSMGVVTYMDPPETVDIMIKKSDSLMYEAKSAGKDMIRYEVVGK